MVAAANLVLSEPPGPTLDEQRILLHGVTWKDYVILRDVLDGPSPRMTYLAGRLELMVPSSSHELWKTNIARLIELYAHRKGIDLRGYGSTTFKREVKEAGAEPDECYLIGRSLGEYPEMVLEVIHTSPLLNKLDVYARMNVPEVWIFKNAAFTLYHWDIASAAYVTVARSTFLPDLDFEMLARLALREDIGAALRELEAEIG
jgi:Uma2 family endonuclease